MSRDNTPDYTAIINRELYAIEKMNSDNAKAYAAYQQACNPDATGDEKDQQFVRGLVLCTSFNKEANIYINTIAAPVIQTIANAAMFFEDAAKALKDAGIGSDNVRHDLMKKVQRF